METYELLLKKAREKLPERASSGERFEIPKVKGHVQGNRTVISNFAEIVGIFRRDAAQLLKYLQRELATPAVIDGPRLIMGRKLTSLLINKKIEQYAKDFVLCSECGKPDTQLKKEDIVTIKICTACGARNPVKAKI